MSQSKPIDANNGTNAFMTVYNDNPATVDNPVSITVTDTPHNMGINYTHGSIPASSNYGMNISADTNPGQSSFDLKITDNANTTATYSVDIGSGIYTTKINSQSVTPVGSSSAVLAPGPPLTFSNLAFFFFSGPAIIVPLVQDFLNTNLSAIRTWIQSNPFQWSPAAGLLFEISSIPETISCSYGGVAAAGTDEYGYPNKFDVHIVLNVDGSFGGTASYGSIDGSAGLELNNFAGFLQLTVDVSDPSNLSVEATKLQVSVDNYSLTGVLQTILKYFKVLGGILTYTKGIDAAGFINTDVNAILLSGINTAIYNALHPKKPSATESEQDATKSREEIERDRGGFKKEREGKEERLEAKEKLRAAAGTKAKDKARMKKMDDNYYATWMAWYQEVQFVDLKLPGTHDSATYALVDQLSDKPYDDIKFLWDFDYETSPAPLNKNPFSPLICTGPVLGKYVLDSVNRVSQAQSTTILQQLQDGIRYFDLRIYYDKTDGHCYAHHGLKGPSFDSIIQDVVSFLPQSTTELIILAISHTNFDYFIESAGTNVAVEEASRVLQTIPSANLYIPPSAAGLTNYDLNQLGPVTLGTITGGGKASQVMVLNIIDLEKPIDEQATFPSLAVNTPGYASAPPPDGEDWPSGLIALSIAQALKTGDIVQNVLIGLSEPSDQDNALEHFAQYNNTFYDGNWLDSLLKTNPWNVLTMDWYQQTWNEVSPIVDVVIGWKSEPSTV